MLLHNVYSDIINQYKLFINLKNCTTKSQLNSSVKSIVSLIVTNYTSDYDVNNELYNLERYISKNTKFGKSTAHNIVLSNYKSHVKRSY